MGNEQRQQSCFGLEIIRKLAKDHSIKIIGIPRDQLDAILTRTEKEVFPNINSIKVNIEKK